MKKNEFVNLVDGWVDRLEYCFDDDVKLFTLRENKKHLRFEIQNEFSQRMKLELNYPYDNFNYKHCKRFKTLATNQKNLVVKNYFESLNKKHRNISYEDLLDELKRKVNGRKFIKEFKDIEEAYIHSSEVQKLSIFEDFEMPKFVEVSIDYYDETLFVEVNLIVSYNTVIDTVFKKKLDLVDVTRLSKIKMYNEVIRLLGFKKLKRELFE